LFLFFIRLQRYVFSEKHFTITKPERSILSGLCYFLKRNWSNLYLFPAHFSITVLKRGKRNKLAFRGMDKRALQCIVKLFYV